MRRVVDPPLLTFAVRLLSLPFALCSYVADAGNNRIVVFQAGNGNGASAVQVSGGLLVAAAAVAAALAMLF